MKSASYNATPYQTSCFPYVILYEVQIFSAVSCVKSHKSNFFLSSLTHTDKR